MYDINRYYNSYYYGGYMDYAMMMGSCFCKKSYFRVLNTFDMPLDVQVNDILMAENLKIGEFTRYVKFPPGTYHVLINSGENGDLIFETDIDIDYNLVYTGVVSAENENENNNDICILMVPEEKAHHMTGNMSALRLANLCSDSSDVILSASDGTVLFSDISFCKASCNVAIPSGRYALSLKTCDGSDVLEHRIDAAPKMHYTLFIVGKHEDDSVKIIVPEDGVNYLDLC
ncbi:MAG TPA: hypothetical protein DC024_00285 [Clostridiales bacterium]|nr:hypothetical protein [Clostridiales bacterium]